MYIKSFPEPKVIFLNWLFGLKNSQKIFYFQLCKTEKSNTPLHLRSWNRPVFGIFASINDIKDKSIIRIAVYEYSLVQLII